MSVIVEHVMKAHRRRTVAGAPRIPVMVGLVSAFPRSDGSARSTTRARVRRYDIRQVEILEGIGTLSEVIEDLDRSIELALAEGPRGVVCDLSGGFGSHQLQGAQRAAVEVLAKAGRHVRDWPGTPVAVACPDPQVRDALQAHPLGRHLIVTESLFSAVSMVLAAPTLVVQRLRLAAHPTASRASRSFVTRTLLDWRLGRVIPFASLVVSELVMSSSNNAGTDIDVSVAWDRGALRLAVRDHGPALADQPRSVPDLDRRALSVVAGLSRAFGSLPTADGGKVVWAVLEAPRPRSSTRRAQPVHAIASHESPVFTDGRGLAELPFCAGSSGEPA